MLTIVAYHPTGYEVRIEVESEKLDATIRWLEKHNYRPVRDTNGGRDPGSHRGGVKPKPPAPAGNHADNKKENGLGTAGVATINDDLFGD